MSRDGLTPSAFAADDIDAAFRAQADARADAVALLFEGRQWTFGDLSRAVDHLAAWMIGDGFEPGDRIAWWGKNHADYIMLLLASARVGVVLAVINWRLAEREVTQILADCAPRCVVVTEEFVDRAPAGSFVAGSGGGGLTTLASLEPRTAVTWPPVVPHAPFLLLYTSGTTGLPKGVPQTHNNHLAAYRAWATSGFGVWGTADRCLICLPVFHAIGSNFSLFTLLQGASLHLLREFSLDGMRDALGSGTITRMPLVPTMVDMLVADPGIAGQDHEALRQIYYGGSTIAAPTLRRGMAIFDCDFAQCYAATETTAAGTCLAPEDHRGDDPPLRSCGRAMNGVSLRIVDAAGHDVPDGTVGEIMLAGSNIADGYWQRPAESASAFRDRWYMTGDAGIRDATGLVTIVDRTRDMMISGGENVYPSEVEAALRGHEDVADVAVVGAPDARWGHRIVAAIVARDGCPPPALDTLRRYLDPVIARYKHPRQLLVVGALPRNPTGKLLRQPLIEQAVREWQHGEVDA
jgi:acyl-CoA synthetase (AMP-forming)/AMP-acid ligase II